jgi:hypothetical protein
MLDPLGLQPIIKLAIEGIDQEGWYTMGKIKIER